MSPLRVGIDSYSLSPLKLPPLEVLEWAAAHDADGVQFSEVNLPEGQRLDDATLKELARRAGELGLYLEWGGGQHIPFDTTTWQARDLGPINRLAAEQAAALGTKIIRSCSGGLMRWTDEAPATEVLLQAMAAVLEPQMPMLADLNVTLAIETHFEFTTFELLRLFEMCNAEPGGCLGICLDTMNLLTMLEDPIAATERVLPWVVATHIKDGGMLVDDAGLISFTAEVGAGLIDLKEIIARLSTLEPVPNLSIEDHGGSFEIPIFDPEFLARFPDLTAEELNRLLRLARENGRCPREERVLPIDREQWPALCEHRVRCGIANLKRVAAHVTSEEAEGDSQ
ncbi:MAG: sugar phosphate isomerase/epimerase [Phycisphaerales bacterium]|nr:MAG: sugar phosphate isomerase/epimerase [Phycisphaerales bacterium]